MSSTQTVTERATPAVCVSFQSTLSLGGRIEQLVEKMLKAPFFSDLQRADIIQFDTLRTALDESPPEMACLMGHLITHILQAAYRTIDDAHLVEIELLNEEAEDLIGELLPQGEDIEAFLVQFRQYEQEKICLDRSALQTIEKTQGLAGELGIVCHGILDRQETFTQEHHAQLESLHNQISQLNAELDVAALHTQATGEKLSEDQAAFKKLVPQLENLLGKI